MGSAKRPTATSHKTHEKTNCRIWLCMPLMQICQGMQGYIHATTNPTSTRPTAALYGAVEYIADALSR